MIRATSEEHVPDVIKQKNANGEIEEKEQEAHEENEK